MCHDHTHTYEHTHASMHTCMHTGIIFRCVGLSESTSTLKLKCSKVTRQQFFQCLPPSSATVSLNCDFTNKFLLLETLPKKLHFKVKETWWGHGQ